MNNPTPLYATTDLERMAEILSDPEAAIAALPQAERDAYERAKQSVIDARRYAERHAHEWWVG